MTAEESPLSLAVAGFLHCSRDPLLHVKRIICDDFLTGLFRVFGDIIMQTTQQTNDRRPAILTETEIAEVVRCNVRTLRRARAAGTPVFPYVLVGDKPMYLLDAVLKSFERGQA